jgi:hypothetical protein
MKRSISFATPCNPWRVYGGKQAARSGQSGAERRLWLRDMMERIMPGEPAQLFY